MGLSHFSKKEMKHVPKKIPCKDHLGNEFPSINAMCKHYCINRTIFNYRRNEKQMSIEEALTTPVEKRQTGSCKDHLGNVFPSKKAMYKYYDISKDIVNKRIKEKKMSLKEALTTPIEKKYNGHCKDHLGNEFPNQKAMCEYYGISVKTFSKRRNEKQMSLEEALTTPLETKHSCPCKDHLGNEFPSMSAMCKHYGVNIDTFKGRIENNSSIEEALGIIPFICFRTKNTRITDNLFIKEVKAIRKKMLYAVCIYNNTETLLTHDEIIEIYRSETRNAP